VEERSDSMVQRASAWARSVLSGQHLSRGGSRKSSAKPVSLPVKEAVVVVMPDG